MELIYILLLLFFAIVIAVVRFVFCAERNTQKHTLLMRKKVEKYLDGKSRNYFMTYSADRIELTKPKSFGLQYNGGRDPQKPIKRRFKVRHHSIDSKLESKSRGVW